MNSCLRSLFIYFEGVLHPASGWAEHKTEKRKRRAQKSPHSSFQPSPDHFNMRASAKKQDKSRRNPAP
jgi:hypothetical protein